MSKRKRGLRGLEVFEAFGRTREEAMNLAIRAELMSAVSEFICSKGMTQREAAAYFGVTQNKISYLLNNHIEKFTVDYLLRLLIRVAPVESFDISVRRRRKSDGNVAGMRFELLLPAAAGEAKRSMPHH